MDGFSKTQTELFQGFRSCQQCQVWLQQWQWGNNHLLCNGPGQRKLCGDLTHRSGLEHFWEAPRTRTRFLVIKPYSGHEQRPNFSAVLEGEELEREQTVKKVRLRKMVMRAHPTLSSPRCPPRQHASLVSIYICLQISSPGCDTWVWVLRFLRGDQIYAVKPCSLVRGRNTTVTLALARQSPRPSSSCDLYVFTTVLKTSHCSFWGAAANIPSTGLLRTIIFVTGYFIENVVYK